MALLCENLSRDLLMQMAYCLLRSRSLSLFYFIALTGHEQTHVHASMPHTIRTAAKETILALPGSWGGGSMSFYYFLKNRDERIQVPYRKLPRLRQKEMYIAFPH